MPLTFSDGEPFSTGLTSYQYRPATPHENTSRIILKVALEGIVTDAMVDTGGVYLVCNPRVTSQMNLEAAQAVSGPESILFRGVVIQGRLYRLNLRLLAEEREDCEIDATAFVPEGEDAESWGELPCILGLQGCLERLRMANDPVTETFYFGPVD